MGFANSVGKESERPNGALHLSISSEGNDGNNLYLSWFKLPRADSTVKFLLYSAAVFVFFIIYGFFQELIFRLEGFKPYGLYLTLYQFLLYVIFSCFERHRNKDYCRKIPMKQYLILAGLTVATMGLSNASVGYLNYPTQVVFKCCKLVPVLIGGILIQGKIYGVLDFIAAILMSAGLTLFTLADSKVSANFNLTGVILISSALVADAAIGNLQEKTLKQYLASNCEMVFYSYFIGFFYILFLLIFLGQLGAAFGFCSKHLLQTYGYGFFFSLTGYCGVKLVLSLVKLYGAFTAVTVTTCRKAVTILLSFLLFSKPFTIEYLWSGLIVVTGIYLNLYSKNYKKHVLNKSSGIKQVISHCQNFFSGKRTLHSRFLNV